VQHKPMQNQAVQTAEDARSALEHSLHFLSLRHICAIDEALTAIGPYGEVRLIKHAGRLRFIERVISEAFNNNEDS